MTNGYDDAFATPTTEYHDEERGHLMVSEGSNGLTKREYFAAMAMQGLTSNHRIVEAMATIGTKYKGWPPEKLVAAFAAEYADALIDALNAGENK